MFTVYIYAYTYTNMLHMYKCDHVQKFMSWECVPYGYELICCALQTSHGVESRHSTPASAPASSGRNRERRHHLPLKVARKA